MGVYTGVQDYLKVHLGSSVTTQHGSLMAVQGISPDTHTSVLAVEGPPSPT